jgi:CheY-like chemotaxis protein
VSRRLLVVDDDKATRQALGLLLTGEGYVVELCDSGAGALERLRSRSYDVLLTDLVMSGMTGLELIRAARALYPAQRCLILSGHESGTGGVSDVPWISKPIDIDELLAALGPA